MKVMMVTPYFYPKRGGLEYYSYNILKRLINDFKVHAIVCTTNHRHKKHEKELYNNLEVYRFPHSFKISNTPINISWKRFLRNIISKTDPNIINGHLPVPYIADIAARVAKKKEIPFVLTYHNDLTKETKILDILSKGYYLFLGNKTLKISDRITTTSRYYTNNSLYLKKHLRKVDVVPPGVDLERFNSRIDENYLRERHNIKEEKLVLFVGQLDKTHRHKGLDYLIKAIAEIRKKVKSTRLVVVGDGNLKDYYKVLAKKMSLHDTIFAGFISDEELPYYYRGCDVTVLPSYLSSEGFGMVLIEANACGRPVVGTKVGGIPYVIRDRYNGLLAEPKNSEKLAKAILTLIKDDELAKTLGKAGEERVRREFTWERSARATYEIFEDIA